MGNVYRVQIDVPDAEMADEVIPGLPWRSVHGQHGGRYFDDHGLAQPAATTEAEGGVPFDDFASQVAEALVNLPGSRADFATVHMPGRDARALRGLQRQLDATAGEFEGIEVAPRSPGAIFLCMQTLRVSPVEAEGPELSLKQVVESLGTAAFHRVVALEADPGLGHEPETRVILAAPSERSLATSVLVASRQLGTGVGELNGPATHHVGTLYVPYGE